jgi:hypothetical protein
VVKFPLDVFSVKDIGLDRWLKYDMAWPIHDDESIRIGSRIVNEYSELIKKEPDSRLRAILIAQNKLVLELSGIFHSLLILERLSRNNYEPLYRDDTIFFPSILGKNKKINGVFERYRNKIVPTERRGKGGRLRMALLWLYRKIVLFSKSETTIFSLNANSNFYLDTYAKETKKKIKFYPIDEYKKSPFIVSSTMIDIDEIRSKTINILERLGLSYQLDIPSFIIDYLNKLITEVFLETNYQIEFYYRKLSRIKPSNFFIPSLGHIDYRSFGLAAKIAGHKVVGSSHGNSIGMFDIQLRAFIDLSIVDIFLVVTEYSAKNYRKLQKKYLNGISETNVFSVNSDFYRELMTTHTKLKPLSELKHVMVIEYPLTETRHNKYSFWPYQLKLMLKVGDFLKREGLSTTMKRHPDRILESDDLYLISYDHQLTQRFEDVFEQADAFLFMNITSTTFGFAMTTNRPIFIFSVWLDEVWEEMIPLIEKRCIVIPSWIDENGSFYFDEEFFSSILKSDDLWNINYEAVDSFMIPR